LAGKTVVKKVHEEIKANPKIKSDPYLPANGWEDETTETDFYAEEEFLSSFPILGLLDFQPSLR